MTTTYYTPPLNAAGIGNNDYGARWGDALGNARQLIRNGFTSEDYRDTNHELEFNKHNLASTVSGEIQIDHDWALDSEIRVHLHVIPMAAATGDVYWTWQYYFGPLGVAIPAVASWTSGNTTTTLTSAEQYWHRYATIFTFTPTGGTASSILLFDITRPAAGGADTYTTNKDHGTAQANVGLLYVDAHYQKNSPGTATELA